MSAARGEADLVRGLIPANVYFRDDSYLTSAIGGKDVSVVVAAASGALGEAETAVEMRVGEVAGVDDLKFLNEFVASGEGTSNRRQ